MAQIFHPGADTRLGLALIAVAGVLLLFVFGRNLTQSNWITEETTFGLSFTDFLTRGHFGL